jgi:hypothetical protein
MEAVEEPLDDLGPRKESDLKEKFVHVSLI